MLISISVARPFSAMSFQVDLITQQNLNKELLSQKEVTRSLRSSGMFAFNCRKSHYSRPAERQRRKSQRRARSRAQRRTDSGSGDEIEKNSGMTTIQTTKFHQCCFFFIRVVVKILGGVRYRLTATTTENCKLYIACTRRMYTVQIQLF